MHRSNSVNFSPEGCSLVVNMASVSPPQVKGASIKNSYSMDLLPRYNDREKKRSRFGGEHCVHFIPVVLVLCGLVLWFVGGAPLADFTVVKHEKTITTMDNNLPAVQRLKELDSISTSHSTNSKPSDNESMARASVKDNDQYNSKLLSESMLRASIKVDDQYNKESLNH